MRYNHASLWMSQIVDWGRQYIDRPFLVGVGLIGWVPALCTLLAVDVSEASTLFLIGQALACLGVVFAPFDIWYYDEQLLPTFFDDVEEITTENDKQLLHDLSDVYDSYYSNYWWVSTVPWVILVLAVYVVGLGYFESQGITTRVEQAAYLGFFIYWLVIAGLRSHSVIVTMLAIRAVATKINFDIDPLHPDGLGGLSTVGNLAIQTTIIISTGSFALPLSFQLATHLQYEFIIYTGVGLFIFLVAFNFVYPTYIVNRRAQSVREAALEERRQRIRELEGSITDPKEHDTDPSQNHDLIQMEIQRARRDYKDYENVTLYPLSIGIIIRLVSSVLLPILFTLFDYMLSQLL